MKKTQVLFSALVISIILTAVILKSSNLLTPENSLKEPVVFEQLDSDTRPQALGANGTNSGYNDANNNENIDTITTSEYIDIDSSNEQLEVIKEPIENQIVVKLDEDISDKSKNEYLEALGDVEVEEIEQIGSVVITYPESYNLEQITESEVVASEEQDFIATELGSIPNDPDFKHQWVPKKYKVVESWADDQSEIIAVLDTGICFNHPDLQGRILQGIDLVNDDNYPEDQRGHGCAVSGIIAANTNNSKGVAGMHSKAKILPVKVLNSNGTGSYSDIAQGIIYATDHGADVINLSLGGTGGPTFLKNAVDYAVSHGVVVVAAAGNSNQNGALYPAKYNNVVAVGALNDKLEKASFSNYGNDIDVWAPGEKIYTTTWDNRYINKSGTSYAAPHVSALGANFFKDLNNRITEGSNTTQPAPSTPVVTPAPSAPAPTAPVNPSNQYLTTVNEQFKQFSGWNVNNLGNLEVKHINSMLRIESANAGLTPVSISSELISLKPNTNYYLSADIQTANATTGKIYFNLYDENLNFIGTAQTLSNDINSRTLANYTTSYNVPSELNGKTVKYGQLVLEASSKLNPNSSIKALTLFDNIYLSTTPR